MNKQKLSIKLVAKGFCMGVADIIPGISGGTIAFLLGIYEDFIEALSSIDKVFFQKMLTFRIREAIDHVHWRFLLCLFSGIISAVVLLSKLLSWLLTNHPENIHGFFFGLIVATVPIIARVIRKWTVSEIVLLLVSWCITYYVVTLKPIHTPDTLIFLFLSAAIAISAMILPGISGSFILLILGKYQVVLDAINERDLIIIAVFGAGVVFGILSVVRIIRFLLHKYHDQTMASITGIILGSLYKIWPWNQTLETIESHGKTVVIKQMNYFPDAFSTEVILTFGLMILGFVLALLLNRTDKSVNR